MAYPQYDIRFQSQGERATVMTSGGVPQSIETDGSHSFVLDVGGTRLNVELAHKSDGDRTPRLVLTFK
jgi:hypothetical protein